MNSIITILLVGALIAASSLFFISKAKKSQDFRRGWRIQSSSVHNILYQEFLNREWVGIEIRGERRPGDNNPYFYIFHPSENEWLSFPQWAQNRRHEIISRIKTEFPEPGCEHVNA